MAVDAPTHLPGGESIYLGFRTTSDEQENVEISVEEAVALHGWLTKLVNRIQGQGKATEDMSDEEITTELAKVQAELDEIEQGDS